MSSPESSPEGAGGSGLAPLPGGYSGETFMAEVAGERTVVRIYAGRGATRGDRAVEVDAAVLRLVHGLLPVPAVLEVRRPDPAAGTPAVLVTSHLPGVLLERVLPGAGPVLRAELGRRLGELVARLAGMPMLRTGGFVDPDLRIGPLPAELADLPAWVAARSSTGPLADWSADDRAALQAVADAAQRLLDEGSRRACLVHSDLNAKNVLVDPATGAVTGLVDWEFAHAGSPYTDLGNLLRLERDPVFAEAVLATYAARVPDAPGDRRVLLDRARAADLYALVDLASRQGDNPVAASAHDRLLAIARSRDLGAW